MDVIDRRIVVMMGKGTQTAMTTGPTEGIGSFDSTHYDKVTNHAQLDMERN